MSVQRPFVEYWLDSDSRAVCAQGHEISDLEWGDLSSADPGWEVICPECGARYLIQLTITPLYDEAGDDGGGA